MKLSHHDEILLQRHLDGELDAAAAAAFSARLTAEPELARARDEAETLRAGFAAARTAVMRPSPGFAAGVLAAVRQLPTRLELERADVAASTVVLCRRILLAAAVIAALGLLWHSGLVRDTESKTLQAAPAEIQQTIDRLDALLESGAVPPADASRRSDRK